MIRRPPRSTQSRSSAASDVYKRQPAHRETGEAVTKRQVAFFQQGKCAPTSTDKKHIRFVLNWFPVALSLDHPSPGRALVHTLNVGAILKFHTQVLGCVGRHLLR